MLLKMQFLYLNKDKKKHPQQNINASAIIAFANSKLGMKIKLKREGISSKLQIKKTS